MSILRRPFPALLDVAIGEDADAWSAITQTIAVRPLDPGH